MNPVSTPVQRIADQSPSAGGPGQLSLHTVIIALRCWWHLALPLGLLLSVAAAATTYYLVKPKYTASTWLLIRERALVLLPNSAVEDPRKFVQNQIELLRSPPVLERVVSDPAVASAPELVHELDPVQYLRSKLKIKALGQSDFFEVTFTSQLPDKAAVIVNKVAAEYYDMQGRHESKSSSRTIELLQEQQIARQQTVRQLRTTLQELSKQIYGKDAFAVTRQENNTGPTVNPYADLEQRLISAQVERETLAARIKAEIELFEKESFEPSPTEVAAQVEAVPQVREARNKLGTLLVKIEQHKQISKDLTKNFVFQQLDKQHKDDEAALERSIIAMRAAAKDGLEQYAREKRRSAIAALEAQLRALDVSVQVWSERVKDKRVVQKEVAVDTLQYELVKADYERAGQLLDAISSRILSMQTEQRAPERVEIFKSAKPPTRPDEANPYKKMVMAAMMALLSPFALALGVEVLYRRVCSRQQLETGGGITVVAEVTSLPRRAKAAKLGGAPHLDLQLFEESIDGLRTYLTLADSIRSHKVLAVMSAISSEGKTSVSAQLAVSVASASGRPTLLIDGDLRKPDLHKVFDVERGPGLYEVLKGECPLAEAIETRFGESLHLLTAGVLSDNPHRVFGNGKFAALIEKLRESYDHIIIDTPPVLAASEALLMASAADSAIMCVRRDFSRLDQVAEVFARLRTAGVNAAGAVLNGVPHRQYAYKYGSYGYSGQHHSAASWLASASEDTKDAAEPTVQG